MQTRWGVGIAGLGPTLTRPVRDATSPIAVMIPDDDIEPCWSGNIDITPLKNLLRDCEWSAGATEGTIRGMDARHDRYVDVLRRT